MGGGQEGLHTQHVQSQVLLKAYQNHHIAWSPDLTASWFLALQFWIGQGEGIPPPFVHPPWPVQGGVLADTR